VDSTSRHEVLQLRCVLYLDCVFLPKHRGGNGTSDDLSENKEIKELVSCQYNNVG